MYIVCWLALFTLPELALSSSAAVADLALLTRPDNSVSSDLRLPHTVASRKANVPPAKHFALKTELHTSNEVGKMAKHSVTTYSESLQYKIVLSAFIVSVLLALMIAGYYALEVFPSSLYPGLILNAVCLGFPSNKVYVRRVLLLWQFSKCYMLQMEV